MAKNKFTRRFFIGGMAALGAFSGCRVFTATSSFRAKGALRLKFGVISDVHISWGKHRETFRHALEYYRDNGVDAVMICGDIVDYGLVSDLQCVADDWNAVFPNNRAPDGRVVEKVFVTGNHDWMGHKYDSSIAKKYPDRAEFAKRIIQSDLKGNWERIFGEQFSPMYIKDIKGYKFVGAHWVKNDANGWNENFNDGIKDFYAKHAKEFDPALPFFHAQHPHLKDTCYGPWAWGRDVGDATAALSRYPNAVAFSGHSHYALTDERSIWQGDFTSIGTSSLYYSAATANQWPDPGYENYSWYDGGKVMHRLDTSDGRQGMLICVYDDAMVISRRDFLFDRSLGGDWVMPLPAAESKPFAYATRAKSSLVPEFASGSSVTVTKGECHRRTDYRKTKGKKAVYNLRFPAAISTDKTRAYEYEITFVGKESGKRVLRRLVAPGFHLPVDHKRALDDVTCSFLAETLPPAPFTVEVRALSSFMKAGPAIKGSFS